MNNARIPRVEPFHRGSSGWFIEDGRVNLICGGCGNHAGHMSDHTIHEDGRVTASILCPVTRYGKTCGWHVYGTLLDWKYGKLNPGERLPDTCIIKFNGEEMELPTKTMTYEQVIALAGYKKEHCPSTIVKPPRGESFLLYGDKVVYIEEGMYIECIVTGNA